MLIYPTTLSTISKIENYSGTNGGVIKERGDDI